MLLYEFVSNDTVKNELNDIMRKQKLPHAIIIDGAKGTGKKTLAMIIAQYCICSSNEKRPCGICPDCTKFILNSHPDVFVADGNTSGALNIEAIRNIRSSAYIKPNEADRKVYILLNCDKMLTPAQNAFLKILEEPPENVIFIMTCISASALLQTVRSRARIFSLYPAENKAAAKFIESHFSEIPISEIQHAISVNGGNIGMAIQMLKGNGEEAFEIAEKIFAAIPQSSGYQLMQLTNTICSSRTFAVSVLDALLEISAETLKASVGIEINSKTADNIAKRISRKKLFIITENIRKARNILNANINMNLFGMWLYSVLKI